METYPYLSNGELLTAGKPLAVLNPYNGSTPYQTYAPEWPEIDAALDACIKATPATAALPAYRKQEILREIANRLHSHRAELADTIVKEAGKPLQYALSEVDRAVTTFGLAADYARTLGGEVLPLDLAPGQEGSLGLVRRYPVGTVLGISPFNFPLNLVAHKLAPAILAGCPFILKPASKTPITAIKLGQLILAAGYPPGAVHILPFSSRLGEQVIADPRVKLLSFTGGVDIGWELKKVAYHKKVVLELGGDAAAIVAADADLEAAARKCATGAFSYAGQICISIQRIAVVDAVYDVFKEKLLAAIKALPSGDPQDAKVVVGPMIDRENYDRIQLWVAEAVAGGATLLLTGDDPAHNLIYPQVLENVPRGSKLSTTEAFGPIVELIRVPNIEAAFAAVNASRYGLQAGIFTVAEAVVKQAFAALTVGGVVVNNAPTLRIDSMPYGGVKDSGFGREGVKYAYEDMTELRLLVW